MCQKLEIVDDVFDTISIHLIPKKCKKYICVQEQHEKFIAKKYELCCMNYDCVTLKNYYCIQVFFFISNCGGICNA